MSASALDPILARKREEVARLRRETGAARLTGQAAAAPPPRDFARALRESPAPRVIAEFKRASPSRGVIRAGADPAAIAGAYAAAGAAALSVLTDRPFFQGSLDDLRAARGAVELPVLRKDFTLDELQVLEARAAGADAVLLIVAALEDSALRDLLAVAKAQQLAALVEVHTLGELERARECGAEWIGVNNRDLRTLRTDVSVTRSLLEHARDLPVVSESGIDDPAVLRELMQRGAHAFLIGEALMRAPDPGAELRRLRSAS
jgi:indole-3-glycerol phosphate synthase